MRDEATKTPIRLITRHQVEDRVPLTYPSIWKRMREGTFPRSARSAAGCSGSRARSTPGWKLCRTSGSRATWKSR